jgi:putative DNA primase/helicase
VTTWTASKAFDIVTEALERAGCRAAGDGRQRGYQCPAHEDREPSLSVTDGQDRVLLKCHAGCDIDDILGKLTLTRRDLFDADRARDRRERRRVVAEYPYTDEAGTVLFVKVRFQPKHFLVKRPDGLGGWIWGIGPDTRRVLYRLPRIVATPASDLIWIVEGERDVHALEGQGQVATTNYDGASKSGERPKWRAEYSPFMVGRNVRIVADRDPEGRVHAEYVELCLRGIARTLEVVESAQGKDATDHLGAGLGINDFVRWSR